MIVRALLVSDYARLHAMGIARVLVLIVVAEDVKVNAHKVVLMDARHVLDLAEQIVPQIVLPLAKVIVWACAEMIA